MEPECRKRLCFLVLTVVIAGALYFLSEASAMGKAGGGCSYFSKGFPLVYYKSTNCQPPGPSTGFTVEYHQDNLAVNILFYFMVGAVVSYLTVFKLSKRICGGEKK